MLVFRATWDLTVGFRGWLSLLLVKVLFILTSLEELLADEVVVAGYIARCVGQWASYASWRVILNLAEHIFSWHTLSLHNSSVNFFFVEDNFRELAHEHLSMLECLVATSAFIHNRAVKRYPVFLFDFVGGCCAPRGCRAPPSRRHGWLNCLGVEAIASDELCCSLIVRSNEALCIIMVYKSCFDFDFAFRLVIVAALAVSAKSHLRLRRGSILSYFAISGLNLATRFSDWRFLWTYHTYITLLAHDRSCSEQAFLAFSMGKCKLVLGFLWCDGSEPDQAFRHAEVLVLYSEVVWMRHIEGCVDVAVRFRWALWLWQLVSEDRLQADWTTFLLLLPCKANLRWLRQLSIVILVDFSAKIRKPPVEFGFNKADFLFVYSLIQLCFVCVLGRCCLPLVSLKNHQNYLAKIM